MKPFCVCAWLNLPVADIPSLRRHICRVSATRQASWFIDFCLIIAMLFEQVQRHGSHSDAGLRFWHSGEDPQFTFHSLCAQGFCERRTEAYRQRHIVKENHCAKATVGTTEPISSRHLSLSLGLITLLALDHCLVWWSRGRHVKAKFDKRRKKEFVVFLNISHFVHNKNARLTRGRPRTQLSLFSFHHLRDNDMSSCQDKIESYFDQKKTLFCDVYGDMNVPEWYTVLVGTDLW